jgi:hypothetical protein
MEPQTQTTETPKAPKHRSPSYPAIDLQKALDRTKQLAKVAGRHAAPVSAVLGEWGYSPKSSNGLLTIAAVKKFGLVTDEGKQTPRQLRLTQLGHEVVVYDTDRDSTEWMQRAQEAVLKPAIIRDLWTKYDGQLPADSVMRPYLVIERGFSDSAAKEVLRILRLSISFAKMELGGGGSSVSPDEPDADENEIVTPVAISDPGTSASAPEPQATPLVGPAVAVQRAQRTVQVPYSPGEWALLQAAFPMSSAAWDQMIAVLNAMKPGLVAAEEG